MTVSGEKQNLIDKILKIDKWWRGWRQLQKPTIRGGDNYSRLAKNNTLLKYIVYSRAVQPFLAEGHYIYFIEGGHTIKHTI